MLCVLLGFAVALASGVWPYVLRTPGALYRSRFCCSSLLFEALANKEALALAELHSASCVLQ